MMNGKTQHGNRHRGALFVCHYPHRNNDEDAILHSTAVCGHLYPGAGVIRPRALSIIIGEGQFMTITLLSLEHC